MAEVGQSQEKRVKGYPHDPVRQKEELVTRTYEYDMPFNYQNVTVWRKYMRGNEFHGVELATRNEGTPGVRLRRPEPGEWTRLQLAATVPPEAATAVFLLDIGGMAPDETVWLADASVGVVSEEWEPGDGIPDGTINLIANPTFAGGPVPPVGWRVERPGAGSATGGFIPPAGRRSDLSGIGSLAHEAIDEQGHAGLRLRQANLSLYTEFPVEYGQRLAYSVWAKSTNPSSQALHLSCKWKRRDGLTLCDRAGDAIIITEDDPIVRVAVIGSACTPPGYVLLEAEPCEDLFRRGDMVAGTAPVRFRQSNLWGMHLRIDQWRTWVQGDFGYGGIPEGFKRDIPILDDAGVKAHYSEVPLAGMSCAVFEIPRSRKVTITGGSDCPIWLTDNCGDDDHYSFRTIRTTVISNGRR